MLEKAKTNLRIYGKLFIFLAIWNAVWPVVNYFSGQYDIANLAATNNISESYIYIALIIIEVVIVIFALLELLIGISAVDVANGKANKKLHTGLLKFFFVMEAIVAIAEVVAIFSNTCDYLTLGSSFASLVVIFDMLKCNKEITNK